MPDGSFEALVQDFVVERGHVLAFARAVGEPDPTVDDDVPATFLACTVAHHPAHMLGMTPTGALAAVSGPGTVLHAEQEFEYLGSVRVGDRLRVSERPGRRWVKQRADGSGLTFTELVKEISREDEVVVRCRMVLVRVDDTGRA